MRQKQKLQYKQQLNIAKQTSFTKKYIFVYSLYIY